MRANKKSILLETGRILLKMGKFVNERLRATEREVAAGADSNQAAPNYRLNLYLFVSMRSRKVSFRSKERFPPNFRTRVLESVEYPELALDLD